MIRNFGSTSRTITLPSRVFPYRNNYRCYIGILICYRHQDFWTSQPLEFGYLPWSLYPTLLIPPSPLTSVSQFTEARESRSRSQTISTIVYLYVELAIPMIRYSARYQYLNTSNFLLSHASKPILWTLIHPLLQLSRSPETFCQASSVCSTSVISVSVKTSLPLFPVDGHHNTSLTAAGPYNARI